MHQKTYYVYILTNKPHGVLYIGVTCNINQRIWQHKQKLVKGFTSKHNLIKLVYYKDTNCVNAAIEREKNLKNYHRPWKIKLIESKNPNWEDLYYGFE